MHPDLARQCVVGPALFGHPAWNLAMVPAVGTHGHRIFTTVGLVDYGWVQRFAKRYRKPEGPGFLQRSTRSIRWCAQSAARR
jgi:hypothetical protein